MDLGLKDKVVIVTGAGEGLGRRVALLFTEEGASVVVNDIIASKAEDLADEVRSRGGKALAAVADVTNADEVNEMVNKVLSEFGRIDILVNNAFASDRKVFTQSSRADWEKPINVCLYGVLNCTRAVINHMVAQRYGKVISVISDAGRIGEPHIPVYAATKGGILAFSRSLAKEVGSHNINVNCVSPSAMTSNPAIQQEKEEWERATTEEERAKTHYQRRLRLYPLGRISEPEDVANMIVFLASERARQITGQVVSVSAGYVMV